MQWDGIRDMDTYLRSTADGDSCVGWDGLVRNVREWYIGYGLAWTGVNREIGIGDGTDRQWQLRKNNMNCAKMHAETYSDSWPQKTVHTHTQNTHTQ